MALAYEPVCGTEFAGQCRGTCRVDNVTGTGTGTGTSTGTGTGTGTWTCECPSGWEHDRVGMRRADCSAPVGFFQATFGVALYLGVVSVGMALFALRRLSSTDARHKSLRHIVLGLLFYAVLSSAAAVTCLVQDFVGRAYFVLFAMALWGFAYSNALMLQSMYAVAYRIIGRNKIPASMRRFISMGVAFNFVATVGARAVAMPIIALALGNEFAPTYDVHTFNLAVAVTGALIPVLLFGATPLTLFVTTDLIRAIDDARAAAVNGAAAGTVVSVSPERDKELLEARKRFARTRFINVTIYPVFIFLVFTMGSGYGYAVRWNGLPFVSFLGFILGMSAPIGQLIVVLREAKHARTSSSHVSNSPLRGSKRGFGAGATVAGSEAPTPNSSTLTSRP